MSEHRILILVTHLHGTGHLSRALTLARAFQGAGHPVRVISGGLPAPQLASEDVHVVQLAPLRSNGTDFSKLLTPRGEVAGPEDHAARTLQILAELDDFDPSCLITELFPFGRRSLRKEFIAVLEAARARPKPPRIFASIRDILAPPSKPEKAAYAEQMIAAHYDGVLVHSDPALVPLEVSWPVTPSLAPKLHYTGFVAPALPDAASQTDGRAEILVSAGGGALGERLFPAALEVARQDTRKWRFLVGGHDAPDHIARLAASAPTNVLIERPRRDFRAMLQVAQASVSLCGYNTAMDVLQTGLPAVMVAFDEGSEREQSLRIKALEGLPQLRTLPLHSLTSAQLSDALAAALADPTPRRTDFGFNGAARTVEICTA